MSNERIMFIDGVMDATNLRLIAEVANGFTKGSKEEYLNTLMELDGYTDNGIKEVKQVSLMTSDNYGLKLKVEFVYKTHDGTLDNGNYYIWASRGLRCGDF